MFLLSSSKLILNIFELNKAISNSLVQVPDLTLNRFKCNCTLRE